MALQSAYPSSLVTFTWTCQKHSEDGADLHVYGMTCVSECMCKLLRIFLQLFDSIKMFSYHPKVYDLFSYLSDLYILKSLFDILYRSGILMVLFENVLRFVLALLCLCDIRHNFCWHNQLKRNSMRRLSNDFY